MIRRFISGGAGLTLLDLIKGSRVRRYLRFYEKTLDWDRQKIESFQFWKIKKLLEFAFKNVPFYERRFWENHLTPDSIRSLKDLEQIPPLSRTDMLGNLDDLLAEGANRRGLLKCSSSGTTGIPVVSYKDLDAYSADTAALYLQWALAGYHIGDKRLHIWGNPESIKKWDTPLSKAKRILLNYRNFPSFSLNRKGGYLDLVNLINSWKPDYLDGYASFIYLLAAFVIENKIELWRPKKIFTTAENLYPYQRQVIEEVLAPVMDYYGCDEIGGVAAQCCAGNYHVFEPRVLVEQAISASSNKEILLTDLENFSMPLLRYRVGDLFDGYANNQSCPCGLQLRYFTRLEGRITELVQLPDGSVISPVSVFGGTAFRRVQNFTRHQTYWNGKYFIFIFEVNDQFSARNREELESIIRGILRNYQVDFQLRTTKNIPPSEGKFGYFKIDYGMR